MELLNADARLRRAHHMPSARVGMGASLSVKVLGQGDMEKSFLAHPQ